MIWHFHEVRGFIFKRSSTARRFLFMYFFSNTHKFLFSLILNGLFSLSLTASLKQNMFFMLRLRSTRETWIFGCGCSLIFNDNFSSMFGWTSAHSDWIFSPCYLADRVLILMMSHATCSWGFWQLGDIGWCSYHVMISLTSLSVRFNRDLVRLSAHMMSFCMSCSRAWDPVWLTHLYVSMRSLSGTLRMLRSVWSRIHSIAVPPHPTCWTVTL